MATTATHPQIATKQKDAAQSKGMGHWRAGALEGRWYLVTCNELSLTIVTLSLRH
jgi:hypothetical protein